MIGDFVCCGDCLWYVVEEFCYCFGVFDVEFFGVVYVMFVGF